jgi:putative aldouronate transport system permease protein
MKKIKMAKSDYGLSIFAALFLILLALICIAPYVLVLIGSITDETELITTGLTIAPKKFSVEAYNLLYMRIGQVLNGYKITILVTVIGTVLSLLVNSLMAYPLSKKTLRYRSPLAFFCFFTLLFSGGMVPWYIVCVNYLHLYDSFWALIIPYLANAWNLFLIRNYFSSIPGEICESASIDGAGELRIFFTIILPLAVPVIASVGLFIALGYWNDWWLGIMLTENRKIMPLQLLLRSITSNAQFFASGRGSNITGGYQSPAESIKYATTIVTIGPIVLLYPFVQKYFIKGLTVGSVKG